MPEDSQSPAGTTLRNSLWNLLYRTVSSTDLSGTAWSAILREGCLRFFKQPIDELPVADNEACRRRFRDLFFTLTDHGVHDLYEFLLTDVRSGLKEADRKLIRHNINRLLDEEMAEVRLLRDRFVPLADSAGFDAVAGAEEALSLFGPDAAARHLANALAFLSRRPEPDARESVREAVLSVAAVVRTLSLGAGPVAVGTVSPVANSLGLGGELLDGIERLLSRCHAASGLPDAPGKGLVGADRGGVRRSEGRVSAGERLEATAPPDLPEAKFLVVFCASLIELLLSRSGLKARHGTRIGTGEKPK